MCSSDLDSNSELKVAGAGDKIYGLSKLDSNSYQDFSFGEYAAFGSGQLTVLGQPKQLPARRQVKSLKLLCNFMERERSLADRITKKATPRPNRPSTGV